MGLFFHAAENNAQVKMYQDLWYNSLIRGLTVKSNHPNLIEELTYNLPP